VQRIYEYHRLLLQLYKITPTDHCDYLDLRSTVNSVASVSTTHTLTSQSVSITLAHRHTSTWLHNCQYLYWILPPTVGARARTAAGCESEQSKPSPGPI